MRAVVVGLLLLAAGCFSPHYDAPLCAEDGSCPDGLRCGSDGVCGEPCEAACDGDELISCPGGASGEPVSEVCPIGCAATPMLHCTVLVPSNVPAAKLDELLPQAVGSVTAPSGNFEIDTDTGLVAMVGGANPFAMPGTRFETLDGNVSVLVVDSFVVPPGSTLRGTGTRGLIIVARDEIDIQGTLDFSAGCSLGGAPTPDRKSTRLNSSHATLSRMPSSA